MRVGFVFILSGGEFFMGFSTLQMIDKQSTLQFNLGTQKN